MVMWPPAPAAICCPTQYQKNTRWISCSRLTQHDVYIVCFVLRSSPEVHKMNEDDSHLHLLYFFSQWQKPNVCCRDCLHWDLSVMISAMIRTILSSFWNLRTFCCLTPKWKNIFRSSSFFCIKGCHNVLDFCFLWCKMQMCLFFLFLLHKKVFGPSLFSNTHTHTRNTLLFSLGTVTNFALSQRMLG